VSASLNIACYNFQKEKLGVLSCFCISSKKIENWQNGKSSGSIPPELEIKCSGKPLHCTRLLWHCAHMAEFLNLIQNIFGITCKGVE